MEEILAIVFQVIFELVLQLFGSVPVDFARSNKEDKVERGCGMFFVHAAIGGLCGWISTLISPTLLLPHTWLRIANLMVSPLFAGGVAYLFAAWAKSRGNKFDPATHMWHGILFAFMFGAARFAFAKH